MGDSLDQNEQTPSWYQFGPMGRCMFVTSSVCSPSPPLPSISSLSSASVLSINPNNTMDSLKFAKYLSSYFKLKMFSKLSHTLEVLYLFLQILMEDNSHGNDYLLLWFTKLVKKTYNDITFCFSVKY